MAPSLRRERRKGAGDRRPVISVLVPVWNAEATLGEALASLAAQTYSDWEAVVVDDGSTDGTLALARAWSERDSRVRPLSHEGQQHLGTPATRNLTVQAARGDIAAFLDADDMLAPQALEIYERAFRRRPALGVVYGQAQTLSGAEDRIGRGVPWQPVHAFGQLARFNLLVTSATAVRSVALGEAPFPAELPLCQDWACWLEVARQWPFFFVPEILARRRVHESSVTARMEREGREVDYEVLQATHLRRLALRGSAAERRLVEAGLEHRATDCLLRGCSALRRGHARIAARWIRAGLKMPLTVAGGVRALARVAPEQRRIWRRADPPLSVAPVDLGTDGAHAGGAGVESR